jgi:hypothetical protein
VHADGFSMKSITVVAVDPVASRLVNTIGSQHLSSGFPLGRDLITTTAPEALGAIDRRAPPIIRPEPEPVSAPVEPPPGSAPPGSAPLSAPHFGGDPAPPADPAGPADPPPRFGGDPAPAPEPPAPAPPVAPVPKVAALGTEDELVAAGLKQGTEVRTALGSAESAP